MENYKDKNGNAYTRTRHKNLGEKSSSWKLSNRFHEKCQKIASSVACATNARGAEKLHVMEIFDKSETE